MLKMKDRIPIVVSVVAIALSFATLYLSHLRPARIGIIAGESIAIHHYEQGNVGISLSVSFANQGASLDTVRRVALLVQAPSRSEPYLFEPFFYQRIDENGNFALESMPGPIPVGARDVVTKEVIFRSSSLERPNEFQITEPGTYKMILLGWIRGSVEPEIADPFSIHVMEPEASDLADKLQQKSTTTTRFRQSKWRKWRPHYLTEVEVNALGEQIDVSLRAP